MWIFHELASCFVSVFCFTASALENMSVMLVNYLHLVRQMITEKMKKVTYEIWSKNVCVNKRKGVHVVVSFETEPNGFC